jgi:hypothetical protein
MKFSSIAHFRANPAKVDRANANTSLTAKPQLSFNFAKRQLARKKMKPLVQAPSRKGCYNWLKELTPQPESRPKSPMTLWQISFSPNVVLTNYLMEGIYVLLTYQVKETFLK